MSHDFTQGPFPREYKTRDGSRGRVLGLSEVDGLLVGEVKNARGGWSTIYWYSSSGAHVQASANSGSSLVPPTPEAWIVFYTDRDSKKPTPVFYGGPYHNPSEASKRAKQIMAELHPVYIQRVTFDPAQAEEVSGG